MSQPAILLERGLAMSSEKEQWVTEVIAYIGHRAALLQLFK